MVLNTPNLISTRLGTPSDIPACKVLTDQHRDNLGFLTRGVLGDSIERRRLIVAELDHLGVVGLVRFSHRSRGTETALYDICVHKSRQRQGVGRALVHALMQDCRKVGRISIILKCPVGLDSNDFYRHLGFELSCVQPGRRRELNVWLLWIGDPECSS